MAIEDMFGDLCKIDILAKSAKPMKCEWKLKPNKKQIAIARLLLHKRKS